MSIETELLKIKGNKEMLVAEDALDWAKKNPKSALHKRLEWDDTKAGHQYRIWQVRQLIALHITYEDGERKFVSLTFDRSRQGGGYRNIDDVLRDQSLHEIMLADALSELQRVEAKYERVKELQPVWTMARKVRDKHKAKKGTERRATA
jgi:hypothetical protein